MKGEAKRGKLKEGGGEEREREEERRWKKGLDSP